MVTLWALVTRLLHWDGLADVADGYWGSHESNRRLEIMSDSHTGAFGATAVSLVAVIEVTAIGSFLVSHQSPVLVVPVVARFAATAAAWLGKPARPDGLGRSVMGRPTVTRTRRMRGSAGGLACRTLGWYRVHRRCLGWRWACCWHLGVPHVLALRFGGVTGDVMGASVLITEALLFVAFAMVA